SASRSSLRFWSAPPSLTSGGVGRALDRDADLHSDRLHQVEQRVEVAALLVLLVLDLRALGHQLIARIADVHATSDLDPGQVGRRQRRLVGALSEVGHDLVAREADVRAELADDLVYLGLGQLVLLLGVGGAGEADDVRGAALAGDHAAVALVAGRGAAGVPLDGDQGPAGLDRLDQTYVVDGVRVARELEEHQVTGLRAGGVPLAALHVPVAHHHG